jgi:signal transduction histidine kinase/CheY-like chemotaxis protein
LESNNLDVDKNKLPQEAFIPRTKDSHTIVEETDFWKIVKCAESKIVVELDSSYLNSACGIEVPTQRAYVAPILGEEESVDGVIIFGVESKYCSDSDAQHLLGLLMYVLKCSSSIHADLNFVSCLLLFISPAFNCFLTRIQMIENCQKQAKKIEELDHAKTVFFTSVRFVFLRHFSLLTGIRFYLLFFCSHDLKTPLTLILSPLEDCINDTEKISKYHLRNLQLAYTNAQRLFKIVTNLLEYEQIHEGGVKPRYKVINIAQKTRLLIELFRPCVEKRGLELSFFVDEGELPDTNDQNENENIPTNGNSRRNPLHVAVVDPAMWEKVVFNLIGNAMKYTSNGRISCRLSFNPNTPDHFEFSVEDTGAGIPAECLPRIFERYYRGPVATPALRAESVNESAHQNPQKDKVHEAAIPKYPSMNPVEGTGIGLAVIHEIVRLHGGDIQAQSEEGQGSIFVVRMPIGVLSSFEGGEDFGIRYSKSNVEGHGDVPIPMETSSVETLHDSVAMKLAAEMSEESSRWQPRPTVDFNKGSADNEAFKRPSQPQSRRNSNALKWTTPLAAADRAGYPPHIPPLIYVVDDSPEVGDYLCLAFIKNGWEVQVFENGAEALQAIQESHTPLPSLVVTDVVMPRMNGLELLRAIKSAEETRRIPVIILSGRAEECERLEGLEYGADDYIVSN